MADAHGAGTTEPAPMRLPAPIRALTWEADAAGGGGRWLLPAAAVLEVTRCDTPAPVPLPLDSGPTLVSALLGTVAWRGRRLPLLSLPADDHDPGGGVELVGGGAAIGGIARLRAVVCPRVGDDGVMPAFGLAAIGVPGLVTLREGEVEPANAGVGPPPFTAATLRLRGVRHAVPDLEALSAALAPLAGMLD